MLFNNLLRRFSSRGRKTINVSSSLASRNSEQGKSMTRGEEFLQMIARMQQVLDVEMTQRKERPGTWINDERRAMHREVNLARAARNLSPLDISAIERVERVACGHCDYSHKLALYCAELVLD